jgi:hypothetical protein
VGFYPWQDGIDHHPDLSAARVEGQAWDREELMGKALGYLAAR